jgi:putative transposase
MKNTIEFEPGLYYHEVLRANSDGILFKDSEDRIFFQKQLNRFILPCCEVLAYAILGNHVHLLIRPHPKEILAKLTLHLHLLNLNLSAANLKDYLEYKIPVILPSNTMPVSESVHCQIRFCIKGLKRSYDHYLFRKYQAKGVLWSRNKSTTLLPNPEDITRTILYIHKNPVYHGLVHQVEEWEFTSYHEILEQRDSVVLSQNIIELFSSMEHFLECHKATNDEFGRKPAKNKSTLNRED